mgnify:CR=1 FL=1
MCRLLRPERRISIHKALASLDLTGMLVQGHHIISIHKALASLDIICPHSVTSSLIFQSTRLSRASTLIHNPPPCDMIISIHKALASLDLIFWMSDRDSLGISIHKALASLDGSNPSRYSNVLQFQSTRLSRASTHRIKDS